MKILARRKVVFIIVEGPSDQDALEILLNNVFDRNRVFVYVTHGDITSRAGNNPSNILRKVAEEIKGYAMNNHLDKVHFQQIIHIMDMDGAYVSEEYIVEDNEAQKAQYTLDCIRTCDKWRIAERNSIKSKNMDKLSTTSAVWGVPYAAYYMSCNLDHVLYNKLNSSDEEKETDAYHFACRYRNDIDGFEKFISKSDFSVGGDYISSWNYIKEEKHSLERHTNLGLCFPEKES